MASRSTRIFTDIDLSMIAHPVTGDIAKLHDEVAVKRAIRNLILTKHYERPFNSSIGLQSMLFEFSTQLNSITLKRSITNVIENFEPRAKLDDIIINTGTDTNSIHISIQFHIVNTERPITVDLILERTR